MLTAVPEEVTPRSNAGDDKCVWIRGPPWDRAAIGEDACCGAGSGSHHEDGISTTPSAAVVAPGTVAEPGPPAEQTSPLTPVVELRADIVDRLPVSTRVCLTGASTLLAVASKC